MRINIEIPDWCEFKIESTIELNAVRISLWSKRNHMVHRVDKMVSVQCANQGHLTLETEKCVRELENNVREYQTKVINNDEKSI